MILKDIRLEPGEDGWILSALALPETDRVAARRLLLHCHGVGRDDLSERADPFAALLTVPCMILGERLAIEGTVSPLLLENLETLQDIYAVWQKGARRIRVMAEVIVPAARAQDRVACFFSGGVDSFHSFLKNKAAITDLILIRGYDRALRTEPAWRASLDSAARVAAAEGKRLLWVGTNIREFSDRLIGWGEYSGNVLGAVALTFSRLLETVIVPGSSHYAQMLLNGSHPFVEPLLHNEAFTVYFDGCEASRFEKVRDFIAHSDLALANLRVCWSPRVRVNNCGHCEKCLRTLLELEAAGVFPRCSTFDRPIDRLRLRRLRYDRPAWLMYALELRDDLRAHNPSLAKVLDKVIAKGRRAIAKEILKGHYR